MAWLAAGFMFLGYLVHLTLDEMYSVDVMDIRIKSSFGTALKLMDFRHPTAGAVMAVATVLALWLSPPVKTFVDGLASRDLWAGLNQRLLPQHSWFGLVDVERRATATSDKPSPITTGSLPEALTPASPAPTP